MIPYIVMLMAASVFSIATAVLTWRRPYARDKTGALVILASVVWAVSLAVEMASVTFQAKVFWSKVQFVGWVIIPAGWLIYTLQYTGQEKWITHRSLLLLSIAPLATLLLVFTNETHRLIYSHVLMNAENPFAPLDLTYGLGFWGFLWYTYTLLIFASLMSVQLLIYSRHLYRRQVTALLVTTIVPGLSSAIFYFELEPLPFNVTPLAYLVVSVILTLVNPSRLHLGDIVPVTREIVVDGMSDGVIVLDEQSRVVDLNTAAQKLTGYTAKEAVGRPVEEVLTFNIDPTESAPGLHDTGKEVVLRHRIYDMRVSALSDWRGRLHCKVIVLRDITESKRIKELRHYSERLEELVEERTKELREAERMATIGELAAMVGHDLRNPLTGIAGAAYYLKAKWGKKIDARAKEMFEIIEKDIEYSNKIINDLSDYSREIRLELEETYLRKIVAEALAMVEIPKSVRIVNRTKASARVRVDVQKMKRVFINIIKNAVDAMPEGGKLTIESKETKGGLCVSFTDTGVGIPQEVAKKLWKPLFTTKATGMGLGLSICKRIVEAHEGSVSLESAEGKGTTVTVTVPLAELGHKLKPIPRAVRLRP